jgi:two-component system, response regulator PdtaR
VVILLVEDERDIHMMAQDELNQAGLSVVSAFSADEAVGILERRDDIKVVFTDVNMPGRLDGLMLAAVVRDRWPPVHLIVTSGHPPAGPLPERAVFVPKPYRPSHIVEMIAAWERGASR